MANPHRLSHDISATADRLLAHLPPVHPLRPHLNALVNSPSPNNQVCAGPVLTAYLQPPLPSAALLASKLLQSLSPYLSSQPHVISTFVTLASSASDNSSLLTSAFHGAAHVARAAPTRARPAIELAIPRLAPLIHASAFTTSATPLRHAAIDCLIALATVSSRALLPFWHLFLPPRPGPPPSSCGRSLATLLVCEPLSSLRSKTASAITLLLVGARPFVARPLRSTRPMRSRRRASAAAPFTSASAAVLHAMGALYPVVADALRVESDGVVVAKLARLASELCARGPSEGVREGEVDEMVRALLWRVMDGETDMTSRAAAAAALGRVVGGGGVGEGVYMEVLEGVLRVVGEGKVMAEGMGVLRAVVLVQPRMFRIIRERIQMGEVAKREGGEGYHCVRIVEAFLAKTSEGFHGAWQRADMRDDVVRDLDLAWEMFEEVLKIALVNPRHTGQACAAAAVESMFQLMEHVVRDTGGREGLWLKRHGVNVARDVEVAVELVIGLTVMECSDAATFAALRALSSLPLSCASYRLTLRVCRWLDSLARDEESSVSVCGKARSCLAALIESSLAGQKTVETHEAGCLYIRSGLCAARSLACEEANFSRDTSLSAAERSSIESGRIAAVNLIASSLRYMMLVRIEGVSTEALSRDAETFGDRLANVLRGGGSINVQRICCAAVGLVVRIERSPQWTEKAVSAVRDALEWVLEFGVSRLQLAAATALGSSVKNREVFPAERTLRLFVRCYHRAEKQLGSNSLEATGKSQLASLLETLSSTIYMLVIDADEGLLLAASSLDESNARREWIRKDAALQAALVQAVFRHLSIPLHMAADLASLSGCGTGGVVAENSRLMAGSLSEESRKVVCRVLSVCEWSSLCGPTATLGRHRGIA